MKGVKCMLLGLGVMVAMASVHLAAEALFWTDFIAVGGFLALLVGFCRRD